MKRLSVLILSLIFAIAGCGRFAGEKASQPTNNKEEVVEVKWEFKCYNKLREDIDIEFPYTDIMLNVDGETSMIGTYLGEPYVQDGACNDCPDGTLGICSFWYAGAGDDICVVRSACDTLSVMWRCKEEGSGEEDGFISEFSEIQQIKIPEGAEIDFKDYGDNN